MSAEPALAALRARIEQHLDLLYPEHDRGALAEELMAMMGVPRPSVAPTPFANLWDEGDVYAISYANSITAEGEVPLQTLRRFLNRHLAETLTGIHLLPFFPWTSDDGFAVSDYQAVDPAVGDWADISALAEDFRVMGDLVINHCSAAHPWFLNYQAGQDPGRDYFVEIAPGADLSAVVRPRTSALLRPTETAAGLRHVWCTFSHDQVDLNFANPAVLLEFVKILHRYLEAGISVFRLDAVAFLWKIPGSSCLNLAETHEIVRLLRTLIEYRDPRAILITETNIPNRENLAYFGNANEAHLIYNFSLPPLLVNALVSGSCRHLKTWMMGMPPAQQGTTYFNFIASHDGIGLRPAEGLLDDAELDALIGAMEQFGGQISWRALGGERRPYEINIALIDALAGTVDGPDEHQLDRFICAHTVMLALEGIPAFYIHSLLGSGNDLERRAQTGQARSINRRRWRLPELEAQLADPDSLNARVLARLRELIRLRQAQPAFHPNATQFTMHLGDAVFAFWRQSLDRRQSLFALNNISNAEQHVPLSEIKLIATEGWRDLIGGAAIDDRLGELVLAPYQCAWISNAAG